MKEAQRILLFRCAAFEKIAMDGTNPDIEKIFEA
jgi:hypothetical protein